MVLTVGGTATAGDDYNPLPTIVILGVGIAWVGLIVTPVDDSRGREPNRSSRPYFRVRYAIGWPGSDTVIITDDDEINITMDTNGDESIDEAR